MKRLFMYGLAVFLVLCLTACVKEKEPTETTGASGAATSATPARQTTPAESEKPVPTEAQTTQPAPTEPPHTHTYTTSVTNPTCTENGYTTNICTCGDTYRDKETAATGHKWGSWKTTKAPTEFEKGTAQRSCKVCAVKQSKSLDKLAHTHQYSQSLVNPTCTEKGYTLYTCACGENYKENETAATGHDWQHATCIEPKTCKLCGVQEGDLSAHSYVNGVCTVCGDNQYLSIKEAIIADGWMFYLGNYAIEGEWLVGHGIEVYDASEGGEFGVCVIEHIRLFTSNPEYVSDASDPIYFDGIAFYSHGSGFGPEDAECTDTELTMKNSENTIVKFSLQKDGYLVVTESTNEDFPVGMLLSSDQDEFLRVE